MVTSDTRKQGADTPATRHDDVASVGELRVVEPGVALSPGAPELLQCREVDPAGDPIARCVVLVLGLHDPARQAAGRPSQTTPGHDSVIVGPPRRLLRQTALASDA